MVSGLPVIRNGLFDSGGGDNVDIVSVISSVFIVVGGTLTILPVGLGFGRGAFVATGIIGIEVVATIIGRFDVPAVLKVEFRIFVLFTGNAIFSVVMVVSDGVGVVVGRLLAGFGL